MGTRFPGGKLINLTEDSGSFVADCSGHLQLGVYMGIWTDDFGHLKHTRNYARLREGITLIVAKWRTSSETALFALNHPAQVTPPLISAERVRLQRAYQKPPGWYYLTETGHSEIFYAKALDNIAQINIDAQNAQGIIRKTVDIPLSRTVTLNWQWRLDEHPSVGPEDCAQFHDYFSIGAEFDNGRDLTWIWSQYLENDHHFHCPVKDWSTRETHYVTRTAADPKGEWLNDSRYVYRDVEISQGEPAARIVAIWLIVVSTFSHRRLRGAFRNITLCDGPVTRVL